MALEAGSLLYVLLVASIVIGIICRRDGRPVPSTQPATLHDPAPVGTESKQYANTFMPGAPVHQLPQATFCWPAVWVGPATAQQPPAAPAVPAPASPDALVQRRRPSTITAQITAHGVSR